MQMQTPKTSTKSSSEGTRKVSPRPVSLDTTQRSSGRVVRQLKTTGLETSSSASQPSIRTPKSTSTKTIDRTSPRGPIPELQKKRLGRVAELETQISQLEEALKTVKDQLIQSESWKKQAKEDAEESRKQLLAMSLKLEESQKLQSSEQAHAFKEFDDERDDKAWNSGLEGIKKPNSSDSAALAVALLQIDHLKVQLDTISESEATQTKQAESLFAEIHILKENMAETLLLMEDMKNQLEESKSSESRAQALANETLLQLETAKKTIESLKLNSEHNAISLELDQSRTRVMKTTDQECESEEIIALESELGKLRPAEIGCCEEQCRRIMELTTEMKKSKADIEELKANLMDKETELQGICEENENLNAKLANLMSGKRENELENELKKSKDDIDHLKSKLTSLETELCDKSDENSKLKLEIKAIKKSNNEVARVTEQLAAAQTANCGMEVELRRLKVQMDQWRKAAEAATAMLCNENNDNSNRTLAERTWSMENYSPRKRVSIGSPHGVDIDDDDEFLKKKNGNMLKRIGGFWKNPQNK